MNKIQFLQQVQSILNESDASITGAEMIGADMTDLEHFVTEHYPAAWRRALNIFPVQWFNTTDGTTAATASQAANGPDGTGYILMPADYAKMVSFKMAKWHKACTEAPLATPAIEQKQSLRYLRGTPRLPVCVRKKIVHQNELKDAMYYYSVPAAPNTVNHAIEHFLYVPYAITLNNDTDISTDLFVPLAYLCASMVLTSFEKENAAKAIESKILEMIR